MEKYRMTDTHGRDCTAVLISPHFGAGFSTWGSPDVAMDKRVIEWLLEHNNYKIKTDDDEYFFEEILFPEGFKKPDFNKFLESIGYDTTLCDALYISLVPVGTVFRINEYDGSESLEAFDPAYWETA